MVQVPILQKVRSRNISSKKRAWLIRRASAALGAAAGTSQRQNCAELCGARRFCASGRGRLVDSRALSLSERPNVNRVDGFGERSMLAGANPDLEAFHRSRVDDELCAQNLKLTLAWFDLLSS